MNLSQYLFTKDLTPADFAKKIGRSASTVYRLVNGDTKPDHATMGRIMAVTGGAVMPNDFFDMPVTKPKRKRGDA